MANGTMLNDSRAVVLSCHIAGSRAKWAVGVRDGILRNAGIIKA